MKERKQQPNGKPSKQLLKAVRTASKSRLPVVVVLPKGRVMVAMPPPLKNEPTSPETDR